MNVDAILTDLLKFGIAGVMTAVVVAIAWTVLKRNLDTRESDLKWYREELDRTRQEHLASTMQQQQGFFAALQRMEAAWEKMADAICVRLDSIEQRIPMHPDAITKRRE